MRNKWWMVIGLSMVLSLTACGKPAENSIDEEDMQKQEISGEEQQEEIFQEDTEVISSEQVKVYPVAGKIAVENMEGGVYHVAFDASDWKQEGLKKTLTIEIFDYERYEEEDIINLAEGHVIQSLGREILVVSIEPRENEGVIAEVTINGGYTQENGLSLWAEQDGDKTYYYGFQPVDYPLYYSLGEVELEVASDLSFTNRILNPEEEATDLAGFQDYLANGEYTSFSELSTEVTIEDWVITEIVRHWIP